MVFIQWCQGLILTAANSQNAGISFEFVSEKMSTNEFLQNSISLKVTWSLKNKNKDKDKKTIVLFFVLLKDKDKGKKLA